MLKMTTWWRNLGGLLAACVLSLLIVAPAACACDERPTSAVAYQTVEGGQAHDSAPCEAACCVGGHCHHASSLLDAPLVTVEAPALRPSQHFMIPARALTSRTPSPPDQPPRT